MLGFLKRSSVTGIIALGLLALPTNSYASKLVFVEIYMAPACKDNSQFINDLWKILREDEDVIVVNCNMQISAEKTGINPNEKACVDRRFDYFMSLGYGSNLLTKAIVNGELDASLTDVSAAVKAARSLYEIERITLEREGDILNINIPDFDSDTDTGELYLNVYAPSIENTKNVVDPDIAITKELMDKVKGNINLPFVTKSQITPPKLREVIGQERIGAWNKGETHISIPLSRFGFYGYKLEELGYIVSLHKGKDFGPVVAAGEIKPDIERLMSMPKDPIMEQISYPTKTTPEEVEKEIEILTSGGEFPLPVTEYPSEPKAD